jgi:hypothetical protein
MHPILQSSCALATSRAEARFRIDVPIEGRRGARVVALDDGAATLVRRLAHEPWNGARFYTLSAAPDGAATGDDMALYRTSGGTTRLGAELADGDVTVMIATRPGAAEPTIEAIGRACAKRGIMTAGIVLGDQDRLGGTVRALRPHAQVLLVTPDPQDVAEVLTAIRA